jgi:hypothetical protein
MAPFENVVVVARPFALGVAGAAWVVAVLVVAIVFAAAVVSFAPTPAAESTQSFMLVIDMRVMLSERARAAIIVAGLLESTAALFGFGTNVVNCACSPTGAKSATERARAVVV